MIEDGLVDNDSMNFLHKHSQAPTHSMLKWSLLGIFTGGAFITIEFLPFGYQSAFSYGMVALSVGVAYMIYYATLLKQNEEDKE